MLAVALPSLPYIARFPDPRRVVYRGPHSQRGAGSGPECSPVHVFHGFRRGVALDFLMPGLDVSGPAPQRVIDRFPGVGRYSQIGLGHRLVQI